MDYNEAFVYCRTSQMLMCHLSGISKYDTTMQMITNGLIGMKMFSNLGSFEECNAVANSMVSTLDKIDFYPATQQDSDYLLCDLNKINNQDKIEDLDKIRERLKFQTSKSNINKL